MEKYYQLTKPGIVYGNLLTCAAGFLLVGTSPFRPGLFVATLVGTATIISSACVVNNYIDRGIDQKMARTKNRALVTGEIGVAEALIYATILGIAGALLLARFTNLLTLSIGIIAYVFYVVLYGLAKRKSVHGTLVGAIPGAAPIVAGYTAVTGRFDAGAAILFALMVVWQMPHFYAIAMYRRQDYADAGLPVLPVVKGLTASRRHMLLYIAVYVALIPCLRIFGYAGYTYMVVMLVAGLAWLRLGLMGTDNRERWARQMFRFSLVVILIFSIATATGALLP